VISARALGLYVYLRNTGAPISAESLSKVFKEGREAIRTALSELKKYNMVSTKRERIGNRIMTVNKLVEPIFWALETRRLIQPSELNNNLILNTNSLISKKEYFRKRKEEQMIDNYEPSPMYLEPEERAEYARKMREKRNSEYRAFRDSQVAERIKEKSTRTPDMWSTDDSSYYFAERISSMWNVKPWTSVRTSFKAAFGKARKMYGTTGDIELKMMERFFDGLEHHKHINNPEIIWKVFIRDFGSLKIAIERSTVTPEDLVNAEAILKRQWEKF
jgi:hypothetical protein